MAEPVPAKTVKDPLQIERQEQAKKLDKVGITVTQWGKLGRIQSHQP